MKTVNIQAAKTHLSRLVEEAMAGTEIVLAKAGKPMVRLTPVQPDASARKPGAWRGRVRMARDFNAEDVNVHVWDLEWQTTIPHAKRDDMNPGQRIRQPTTLPAHRLITRPGRCRASRGRGFTPVSIGGLDLFNRRMPDAAIQCRQPASVPMGQ
jgi:prevent-host-death family protein